MKALRIAIFAAVPVVLLLAVFGGLARAGVAAPTTDTIAAWHGPLFVCGFFGAVISLERAVALGLGWAYAAPALAAAGGLAILAGAGLALASGLFVAAGAVLLAASVAVWLRQKALHTRVLAVAAGCWVAGSLAWGATGEVAVALPAWAGFLVLTIAGERLELTRLLPRSPSAKTLFLAPMVLLLLGIAIGFAMPVAGGKAVAIALAGLALWLLAFDIARVTIAQPGLARYIAACLITGYAWLVLAALLWFAAGFLFHGARPYYDAAVHAVFVGFVLSMVFGHAPVILPSVARIRIAFTPFAYAALTLLHATLALRIVGDLAGEDGWRRWGALGNALALALFALTMAFSARRMKAAATHG